MFRSIRNTGVLIFASALIMGSSASAFADDVVNSDVAAVEVSSDAPAEQPAQIESTKVIKEAASQSDSKPTSVDIPAPAPAAPAPIAEAAPQSRPEALQAPAPEAKVVPQQVTVTETVEPPRANLVDDYATVQENGSVVIDALANDDIYYTLQAAYTIASAPAHGGASYGLGGVTGDVFIYTPTPGYSGQDSFKYRVYVVNTDGSNLTSIATIFITVTPLPVVDTDGDGVTDANDKCPGTPPNTNVGNDGCTIPVPPVDADKDKVTDDKDLCPGTSADAEVDLNGCAESQKDDDSDGVMNDKDKCPGTDKDVDVDGAGCAIPVPPACVEVNTSTAMYTYNRNTATVKLNDGKLACSDFTFSVTRWSYDSAPLSAWPQTAEDTAVAVLKKNENKATATVSDGCGQFDAYANSGPAKGTKMTSGGVGYTEVFLNTKATGPTPWTMDSASKCVTPDEEVTATAPTSVDKCGVKDDKYTIPAKAGVEYSVDGKVVEAGTYTGVGTVKVTATSLKGFVLKGEKAWTFTFTDEKCEVPPTEVTPTVPTSVDKCETTNDKYTIPSKEGVVYKVDGVVKAAGTYQGAGTVKVTAEATTGFVLKGAKEWTFVFRNDKCEVPPTGEPPVTEPPVDVPPMTPPADQPPVDKPVLIGTEKSIQVIVTNPVAAPNLASTGVSVTYQLVGGALLLLAGAAALALGARRRQSL